MGKKNLTHIEEINTIIQSLTIAKNELWEIISWLKDKAIVTYENPKWTLIELERQHEVLQKTISKLLTIQIYKE